MGTVTLCAQNLLQVPNDPLRPDNSQAESTASVSGATASSQRHQQSSVATTVPVPIGLGSSSDAHTTVCPTVQVLSPSRRLVLAMPVCVGLHTHASFDQRPSPAYDSSRRCADTCSRAKIVIAYVAPRQQNYHAACLQRQ